ncbi:MAG: AMP-binding protein [Acidimicrobiales bacterium]
MPASSGPEEAIVYDMARNANLIQRMNIGDTVTRSAWRSPGHLAVVDGERRLDYRAFNDEVNRVANSLVASGYGRGDALVLMSGNSLEFLLLYYACAKLGVACVPINLGWQPSEVGYVLGHCGARGVAVEAQLMGKLLPALDGAGHVEEVIVLPSTGEGAPASTGEGAPRFIGLEELTAGSSIAEPDAYVEDRDPVTYLYTSGTTSGPKGVVGSHLGIYMESITSALELGFNSSDRTAAMMPMFHTAQLNGVISPLVIMGGTIVVQRGFDPAALLELIETERITHIFGLPMMYRAMLDHPDVTKRDLSSLRRATYAMAPMPDDDLRRALEVFKCDFSLGFGQTEMAPITTVFKPEQQLTHTGSVGSPTCSVQVGIMDDQGKLLEWGETGEIVYRGPQAMEGYLHDEAATAQAFAHGWFHSGDIGHFGPDGVLWFDDRKKDVIKTGGENVASIEVERALYAAEPRIAEVVVIGLPHERWGEAITAVVIPREGEVLVGEEVLATAKQRLAGFKVPKAVIVAGELPRTSTGKVQKHVLREKLGDFYRS